MKAYSIVIGLLVVLLMAASVSAELSGINKNIVSRSDSATAHADLCYDPSITAATEVGEVTVVSNNGNAAVTITYKDPVDHQWWYTFDSTWDQNVPEQRLKPYPLANGDFVCGTETASINAKHVPIKSTATDAVQYIDVSVKWDKQVGGYAYSENGKPIDGYKADENYFTAIATGSEGAFDHVYGAHGVGDVPYWDCYVDSFKGFVRV